MEGKQDGKNLRRKDLLTSFLTDPLKGTSLARQDSDALKHPRFTTPQLHAAKGHGFWSDPNGGTEPFCSALLWHVRCSFLHIYLLKF